MGERQAAPRADAVVISGKSGFLVEYTVDVVRVDSNGPIPRYQHAAWGHERRWELGAFELRFVSLDQDAQLRIHTNATLQAEMGTQWGFRLSGSDRAGVPEGAFASTGTTDPRNEFYAVPKGQLSLLQETVSGRLTGGFRALILESGFEVASGGASQSFVAESRKDLSGGPSGAHKTTVNFFVLQVPQGSATFRQLLAESWVYAPRVDGSWDGGLQVPEAHGTLSVAGGARYFVGEQFDYEGPVGVRAFPKADAGGGTLVALSLVLDEPPAASASASMVRSTTPQASLWAIPLGVLVAGAGIGGLVSHVQRVHQVARMALQRATQATGRAQPEPKGSLDRLEREFRSHPNKLGVALELGVRYSEAGRPVDALPLLLLSIRSYPRSDAARYHAALCLLQMGRYEEAGRHLEYAFRLNPLNVARFLKEGPASVHGQRPEIRTVIEQFARSFHESSSRGYA